MRAISTKCIILLKGLILLVNIKKERMKIYVLDNGRMQMDKNLMIANSNQATLDNPNKENELHEFPIYTVFIDHPDAKILFDTACNPNSMGEEGRWINATQKAFPYFSDESCHLPNRLEQLGVDPKDVDIVVASHLHLDHAGCLEYFTNATVIVHDDEFSGAMKCYARNQQEGAYIWSDIDAWIKSDLTWQTIARDQAHLNLVDGVKVLNFGSGHAWGMISPGITSINQPSKLIGETVAASLNQILNGKPLEKIDIPNIIKSKIHWRNSL